MYTSRFLHPIRVSLAAFPRFRLSFHSAIPCCGNFEHLNALMNLKSPKSQAHYCAIKSNWSLFNLKTYRQYIHRFRNKGYVYSLASVVALIAAFPSNGLQSHIAYSMNGFHIAADNHQSGLFGGLYSEENLRAFINFIKKLLIPVFLILNVWAHWGHPVNVAVRVILILLSTKPDPSSVHIIAEQLRKKFIDEHPLLYRWMSLQVKMVEIEDYNLFCLARVEIKDEDFTLIGILGSWWIMPFSSTKEVFLFDTSSWKELFSVIKNRFRLAVDLSLH